MTRHETEDERADRRWNDQLQELRVMQTGAQLTAGFLLTLPFQSTFDSLDDLQVAWYLVLVVLAGLSTALVMTPVAIHRWLAGRHVKDRLVKAAAVFQSLALCTIGLLVVGIMTFIFDIVVSRSSAVTLGIVGLVLLGALMLALPSWLVHDVED